MNANNGDPFFKPMSRREKKILKALWKLDGLERGVATKEISRKTRLKVNGISRTLGNMPFDVDCVGGRGGDKKWRLKNCYAGTL